MGGKWPYSWCSVACCFQDLINIVRSILVLLPSSFSSIRFVGIHVLHQYRSIDTTVPLKKFNSSARSDFHMIDKPIDYNPRLHDTNLVKDYRIFLFHDLRSGGVLAFWGGDCIQVQLTKKLPQVLLLTAFDHIDWSSSGGFFHGYCLFVNGLNAIFILLEGFIICGGTLVSMLFKNNQYLHKIPPEDDQSI